MRNAGRAVFGRGRSTGVPEESDVSVPPSGGGVKNGHPKTKTSKVIFESAGCAADGGKPSPPKPMPAPIATSNRPPRLPRQPFTVNTLTADENPELPPDFVGSNYQKRHGVKQDGTFGPDWVWLVTGSNKAEPLVLARIAFWFAEKEPGKLFVTECWNSRWWLYKFYRQLAEEVRVLDVDEVRWAVRSLVRKGILITHYDPKRRKSKLYRIDPVVVAKLEEAAERRIATTRKMNRAAADNED
jgi:hypothetical protein